MTTDLTKRVYAAFDPAPLRTPNSELYVSLDEVRGHADIVSRLQRKILFAPSGKPTCQVLAGHKGSGKSTELYRLKSQLETGEQKMFVVFCEADKDIDRNDVDFPELLIAIVRQMATQLQEREKIVLQPGYFKKRLQGLGNLLMREVDFDKFDLKEGLLSLGITLKGSPDARAEIRKLMEPDTGNLLNAANDVISEAVLELKKKGYKGLVILVDDLDKLVVRPIENMNCSSAEYLFVHRAAQLTAFDCHVIYSMPISLAYSYQENAIKASYGGHVPVVPMTRISTRPPESKPYPEGMKKFREIIAARLFHSNALAHEVFENEEIQDELIRLSAGQPSELMTLVREAIITHDLPINHRSLERLLREGQREYARQLRAEYWPLIKAVRATGACERSSETDALFRELLESRSILQYVNDEEWYGLNPMVALLKEPLPSSSGASS